MARTAELTDEERQSVADQIGCMLPDEEALVAREFQLGESLRARMLTVEDLAAGDGPLRERTIDLGEWRHQVLEGNGVAVLTAASVLDGHGGQSVVEVSRPVFGAALSRAVEQLDEQLAEDDDLAEFLLVPAYYLAAILLSGEQERVLVFNKPDRLSTMETGYLYPAAQFLETLRRYEPSVGVLEEPQPT